MKSKLIAWWHRTAYGQFFDSLDPIDRATFVLASFFAITGGLCFSAIAHP